MDKGEKAVGDYVRFIKKICDEDGLLPARQGRHRRAHRIRDAHRRPAERSSRPGSTSSPTSSASRATGPPEQEDGRRAGRRREGHPRALRAGQPDRGQDPGDDRGRDDPDRHRRRRRRPGQRPVRLRHGPVHVRQADPDHGPDGHGPGRRHQHRARGRHERADPQQGRPHPRRLPPRQIRPEAGRCPCPPRSPSSSPTAASTATAPPRPRSTPSCRASPGLPLRQDLAVTGSLNQKGEIQPIGGVNEKIEGFFDVCRAKGLTGTQGVIIPHQNVQNLMLRRDVVEAVAEGKFHIYPVRTIDEGIEILTGVEAGRRRARTGPSRRAPSTASSTASSSGWPRAGRPSPARTTRARARRVRSSGRPARLAQRPDLGLRSRGALLAAGGAAGRRPIRRASSGAGSPPFLR